MLEQIPVEILWCIFDLLDGYERKKVRLVSKKCYNILCHPRYVKDEVLRFRHCYLGTETEPTTVFINAQRQFSVVEFGPGIIWEDQNNLLTQTLTSIGKETKILEMPFYDAVHCNIELSKIFRCFPEVVELILPSCPQYTDLLKKADHPLKKLKKVRFKNGSRYFYPPKLDIEVLTAGKITIDLYPDEEEERDELFNANDDFQDMVRMYPDIVRRTVSVIAKNFNILSGKELMLEDVTTLYDAMYFKDILSELINLQEICLITRSMCPFVHEVLKLDSVKRVIVGKDCKECFSNLIKSCPNATEWTFIESKLTSCFPLNIDRLVKFKTYNCEFPITLVVGIVSAKFRTLPLLETLKLNKIEENSRCLEYLPRMPRLKHLTLCLVDPTMEVMDASTFRNIIAATPKLETFELEGIKVPYECWKDIVEGWLHIRTLNIEVESDLIQERLASAAVDPKDLELLEMCSETDLEWILFERIPTLRGVTIDCEWVSYAKYTNYLNNKKGK